MEASASEVIIGRDTEGAEVEMTIIGKSADPVIYAIENILPRLSLIPKPSC